MSRAPVSVQKAAEVAKPLLNTGATAAEAAALSCAFTGAGAPLAGAFALIGVLMKVFEPVAARWADDPPRPDFATITVVRDPIVQRRQPSMNEDLDVLHRCATELDECARWLDAALVAFEREQGAERAGADVHAEARRAERTSNGLIAVVHLHWLGEMTSRLAAVVERPGPWGERPPRRSDYRLLPSALRELTTWLTDVGTPPGLMAEFVIRVATTRDWRPPAPGETIVILEGTGYGLQLPQMGAGAVFRNLGAAAWSLATALDSWLQDGTTPASRAPIDSGGSGGSGGMSLPPPSLGI